MSNIMINYAVLYRGYPVSCFRYFKHQTCLPKPKVFSGNKSVKKYINSYNGTTTKVLLIY